MPIGNRAFAEIIQMKSSARGLLQHDMRDTQRGAVVAKAEPGDAVTSQGTPGLCATTRSYEEAGEGSAQGLG